jgi:multidrug efflux pump subunit AcrA (membrane-fusion protein)
MSAITLLALEGVGAAAQPPGPMPVVVAPVHERTIPPALRLVGNVRAERSAVIATEVSGIVASFDAQEGQFLQPGDIICRLDDDVMTLKVEEAQATLAGLEADLDKWENGERPEDIARLQALVEEAQAEVAKTEFERKRVEELFERGRSSDKERHDAEMDYQAAAGRLAQARAQYEKARNGTRAEDLARARQVVAAQQAALRRLQRDLEKTAIRAPFTGAVTMKRTDVGEWVEAGGAVCEMVALETVKVRVDVPEAAIGFAQPGQPATIEVEALGRTFEGTITRLIPQAMQAARTFPVEIDLPNRDHKILPGMFVWAYVPAGEAGARLMATKDAVVGRGLAKQVFVIRPGPDGGSMALPTPVTTGIEQGGEVEIVAEGLRAGDLLVTRGNERLYGPTAVQLLPATGAAPEPAAASQPAPGTAVAGNP